MSIRGTLRVVLPRWAAITGRTAGMVELVASNPLVARSAQGVLSAGAFLLAAARSSVMPGEIKLSASVVLIGAIKQTHPTVGALRGGVVFDQRLAVRRRTNLPTFALVAPTVSKAAASVHPQALPIRPLVGMSASGLLVARQLDAPLTVSVRAAVNPHASRRTPALLCASASPCLGADSFAEDQAEESWTDEFGNEVEYDGAPARVYYDVCFDDKGHIIVDHENEGIAVIN